MTLFEQLKEQKAKGKVLDFNLLSTDDLKRIYWDEVKLDSEIADLFNVPKSKVTYRRRKEGIKRREMIIEDLLKNKVEDNDYNEKCIEEILRKENVNTMSKAVTNFIFRSGPIEDMHANNQLSQYDMKTLNKFMVNRLAYLFELLIDKRGIELDYLINTNILFTTGWDDPESDDGKNMELIKKDFVKFFMKSR